MHVLIVEDEPVIAERLQRQISEILEDRLDRIKHLDNLHDALEYIGDHTIDLLFLDLNLGGSDGFELLQSLSAASFHTIIVSAYADKAIRAFEYGVLDFVAKPFDKPRLKMALDRVTDVRRRQDYGARYLSVKQAGVIRLIEVNQIDYIVASGHYSELVIQDKSYLHDKSIEKLLMLLPPNFERSHRSYIVNMNRVFHISIEAGSKYSLILKDETRVPIGRSRFNAIKDRLDKL